ncbi:putative ATP-dependent RNA helicase DHR1 [Hanseniaspora osmophila]|uniref:RNA helicase n=1 Tax=Hanseniaspora osmophila TaxID=56408 RepID=A0A1E5R092_9ASCO|nr:putative ATP-dependent RNA helicase DHR1 [Hanseniaspora osmophila]
MGTYRKRFNEKARAGHMAKVKDLKKVRNKQFYRHMDDGTEQSDHSDAADDSNKEVLLPMSKQEKEERKRKMHDEIFADSKQESKVSRQKRKRLDKFIDHQLKREEKKKILEEMQNYQMDTSKLTSIKTIGQGKQTKKEQFQEALALERDGKTLTEDQKDVLYEKKEQKVWDKDDQSSVSENDNNDDSEDNFYSQFGDTEQSSGSFIDNRPQNGGGFGFGFSNATVVKNKQTGPLKKYNWRQKVEIEEAKRNKKDDAMDFDSSSEDFSSDEDDDSESSDGSEIFEEDGESVDGSFNGFSNDESTDAGGDEEEKDQSDVEVFQNVKDENNSDFKSWAKQEIKKMEGNDVQYVIPTNVHVERTVREEDLEDGLKEEHVPINESLSRKAYSVSIERDPEIQSTRMKLPVFGEEHRIMEAIHHNDVVILCGETGSGKTTQVPQFLFESGYGTAPETPGLIGITQPRRVAAVSMAKRVGNEMGNHQGKVAHQIRFDTTVDESTRMKFMTDGVLLREMMTDFKLSKYSAVIIDEAHERNINTDILIGMLSRCVKLRAKEHGENPDKVKKLKLIIMSATLRVSDFSENPVLFPVPPPILKVEARQYPVSVHFSRRTAYDYNEEAFKKACKIHQRLPPGAILIFLTGQKEITDMVKKLRKEFPFPSSKPYKNNGKLISMKVDSQNTDVEVEDINFSVKINKDEDKDYYDDDLVGENDSDEDEEEDGFEETLEEGQTPNDPLYVLPLYSLLPTKEQMKVFENPPPGSRLCVVATNVAETSLTIPNVRYVVDCGRSKERKFNEETGVQSFEVDWISKASADQRSGRAGRTGPGHCYRLYSSAVFDRDFDQFSKPEILRMPVESIVLAMKSMAIHNIVNFPFPTPPDRKSLFNAVSLLKYLGALDTDEKITADGKKMSLFPLSPRFSKMLLVGNEHDCLAYVVAIVSALSVGNPFIDEHELGLSNTVMETNEDGELVKKDAVFDEEKKQMRTKFYKSRAKFSKLDKFSDVFRLLSVVSAFDYIPSENRDSFLNNNFLRKKLMLEIAKLRKQVMYIIKLHTSKENIAVSVDDNELKTRLPTETQIKMLKQMVCTGFVDQVAVRADYLFPEEFKLSSKSSVINIPYIPVLAKKDTLKEISDLCVYLHPTSILSNVGEAPPRFLVYQSLQQNMNTMKTRMKPLCDIKSTPLVNIARKGSLLTYSKPLTGQGLKPVDISLTERYCYVVPRFGASVDSDLKIGWDLNPVAVAQKKINGKWHVERIITNKTYKDLEQQKKK